MLLACSPENYTQPNMNTDQAESGWQGTSGWPTVDMYDVQQPWYSETVQPVQPNYAHAAPEPVQSQLFQQPGFQVDPAEQLAMGISRVLWPGSSTGDSWQGPGSSWYTAPPVPSAPPNFRGATHFDASSRIAGVMSTAPVPGQMRCFALQEPFDENMSKQELVDEDFERDVTKAVNAFLEGGDFDEDDDAEGLGSLSLVSNRLIERVHAAEVPDVSGISWSWADIEPLLDKNMNPAAKDKVKMFCSPENIKGLCAKFADFAKTMQMIDPQGGSKATPENLVKLLEILTQDSTTPQKILATGGPSAEPPASKAPLQLEALLPLDQEQVGRNPSTRRTVPPELQRGQYIGLMLKYLPLPPGIAAMHMELLKKKVEDIIKHLIHHQMKPTVSNIQDCLRRQGAGKHEVNAVWNLCYFYRWAFCLWKPDAGEMSIVLLEEPLPPVDDQVVEQLDISLANQVVKKLQASTQSAENPGPADDQLAQDFADGNVTTLMIRNLPTSLQQPSVLDELKRCGFDGRYDFFYMPGIFGTETSCGYAFINLIDIETMKEFVAAWHNSRRFGAELKLTAAAVQGRDANAQNFGPRIKRIRNPALKPVIFEPSAGQTA